MGFTRSETNERYRLTLERMQPEQLAAAGERWRETPLGFLFSGDLERAIFSARDTLGRMLAEEGRRLAQTAMQEVERFVTLDRIAGDVADQIHETYLEFGLRLMVDYRCTPNNHPYSPPPEWSEGMKCWCGCEIVRED